MRTKVPDALPLFRSEMQVRLLALLILQPEREWSLKELEGILAAPASSVHRELKRIEAAGLLLSDTASRPYRFSGASESPLFEPFSELLQQTVGVENELRAVLSLPGVIAAAIHGSWATGKRRPNSDIDVVVVGEASLRDLRRHARSVAVKAGRRIDITLLTPTELRSGVEGDQGFAKHLLNEPTVPLIGNLAEVVRG